jgi:hypothetical protein
LLFNNRDISSIVEEQKLVINNVIQHLERDAKGLQFPPGLIGMGVTCLIVGRNNRSDSRNILLFLVHDDGKTIGVFRNCQITPKSNLIVGNFAGYIHTTEVERFLIPVIRKAAPTMLTEYDKIKKRVKNRSQAINAQRNRPVEGGAPYCF